MYAKNLLLPVGVLMVVLAFVVSGREPGAAQENKTRSTIVQWQYKVIAYPKNDAEKTLNTIGEDGWELCATIANVSGKTQLIRGGTGGNGSIETAISVVFKRPKR